MDFTSTKGPLSERFAACDKLRHPSQTVRYAADVMSGDPADVDLDKVSSEDPSTVGPPNRRPVALLAVIGALMLALAVGWWSLRHTPSEPDAVAGKKPADAAPATQAESVDQITLPPLEETDAIVRQLVGRLSSHPAVAAWLTTDDLVMNFVVVTTNIAEGDTPAAELKKVGPVGPFRTRETRDTLYIDPASYRRYDRFADAVSALDARGVARLYATLKPRVRDGYAKLGSHGAGFDPVLERAIFELIRVPAVDGNVLLQPKGIGYAFADDRLERMSAAQKQFLRMGPQNIRTIQRKLREIAFSLAIPESRLPPA